MVIKLAIAVRVTERAMLPLQVWVIKLLVGPPGETAKTIRPIAIIGSRLKIWVIKNAIIGNNKIWLVNPRSTAFGKTMMRLKSNGVRVIPIPNIMTANDSGKKTMLNNSAILVVI